MGKDLNFLTQRHRGSEALRGMNFLFLVSSLFNAEKQRKRRIISRDVREVRKVFPAVLVFHKHPVTALL